MASYVEKRIRIIGTVGNVYDLRENIGASNTSVIDFSVAVTPRKLIDDEWVDQPTIWTNCTAWGRQAEHISRSFKSGDRVFIEGVAEMKDSYTYKRKNDDGTEEEATAPAREILRVERAGHEVSYADTEQKRNGTGDSAKKSATKSASKPASKQAPKKIAEEPDDDFDFGFDDDDDDDMPF